MRRQHSVNVLDDSPVFRAAIRQHVTDDQRGSEFSVPISPSSENGYIIRECHEENQATASSPNWASPTPHLSPGGPSTMSMRTALSPRLRMAAPTPTAWRGCVFMDLETCRQPECKLRRGLLSCSRPPHRIMEQKPSCANPSERIPSSSILDSRLSGVSTNSAFGASSTTASGMSRMAPTGQRAAHTPHNTRICVDDRRPHSVWSSHRPCCTNINFLSAGRSGTLVTLTSSYEFHPGRIMAP